MIPSTNNLENFINEQCRVVGVGDDNLNNFRYCSHLLVPLNSQDETQSLEFMRKNGYLPILKPENLTLPNARQVYMKSYE